MTLGVDGIGVACIAHFDFCDACQQKLQVNFCHRNACGQRPHRHGNRHEEGVVPKIHRATVGFARLDLLKGGIARQVATAAQHVSAKRRHPQDLDPIRVEQGNFTNGGGAAQYLNFGHALVHVRHAISCSHSSANFLLQVKQVLTDALCRATCLFLLKPNQRLLVFLI